MTDIRDVPYEDIQEFLKANKKSYKNENDAYSKALILLKDNKVVGHTVKIVEWIIAHNLIKKKVNVPYYSSYEINNMPEIEVYQLSKLLTMKSNNRENIINILRYINKLKDMELLPEIVDIIDDLLNELDVRDVYQKYLDFDKIINLLKYHHNKELVRLIIYENLETILDNNKQIIHEKNVEQKYNNLYEVNLKDIIVKFIVNLLEINELGLSARVLDIINSRNYEITSNLSSLPSKILYEVIRLNDISNNDLLRKYFKLIDNDSLIKQAYDGVDNSMSEAGRDYRDTLLDRIKKLYIPFLKVSLEFEKEKSRSNLINIWENHDRQVYTEYLEDVFYDEIEDELYDELKEIGLLMQELEDLIK